MNTLTKTRNKRISFFLLFKCDIIVIFSNTVCYFHLGLSWFRFVWFRFHDSGFTIQVLPIQVRTDSGSTWFRFSGTDSGSYRFRFVLIQVLRDISTETTDWFRSDLIQVQLDSGSMGPIQVCLALIQVCLDSGFRGMIQVLTNSGLYQFRFVLI